MRHDKNERVCPVENAGGLDNRLRRLLQNPRKILSPYVRSGMKALDIGCGPGVFSTELARLVGPSGKVIAADLQEGMLQLLRQKIAGSELEKIICLHKCESEKIGSTEKVDFVLAFYMVHEVPDKKGFFKEIRTFLNQNGKVLVVEPNFHVTEKKFGDMLKVAKENGFEIAERPKVFFSRSVLLK